MSVFVRFETASAADMMLVPVQNPRCFGQMYAVSACMDHAPIPRPELRDRVFHEPAGV